MLKSILPELRSFGKHQTKQNGRGFVWLYIRDTKNSIQGKRTTHFKFSGDSASWTETVRGPLASVSLPSSEIKSIGEWENGSEIEGVTVLVKNCVQPIFNGVRMEDSICSPESVSPQQSGRVGGRRRRCRLTANLCCIPARFVLPGLKGEAPATACDSCVDGVAESEDSIGLVVFVVHRKESFDARLAQLSADFVPARSRKLGVSYEGLSRSLELSSSYGIEQ